MAPKRKQTTKKKVPVKRAVATKPESVETQTENSELAAAAPVTTEQAPRGATTAAVVMDEAPMIGKPTVEQKAAGKVDGLIERRKEIRKGLIGPVQRKELGELMVEMAIVFHDSESDGDRKKIYNYLRTNGYTANPIAVELSKMNIAASRQRSIQVAWSAVVVLASDHTFKRQSNMNTDMLKKEVASIAAVRWLINQI